MRFFCCDDERRSATLRNTPNSDNGIEFLEVFDREDDPPELRQRILFVNFIKPLTSTAQPGALEINNILIEGGERITDVRVTRVTAGAAGSPPNDSPDVLVVEVAKPGDFSTYTLRIVADAARARAQGPDVTDSPFRKPPDGFDPVLSAVDFSFKVLCESDFDCRTEQACPPIPVKQPEINYLAKDYASFRQLMLDRIATTAPEWRERNPADFGIALVELLAYVGDYLSYQQDAVATESYLGTARLRSSVRRHARLVDYFMHDGANARAWIHVRVREGMSKFLLQSFRDEKADEIKATGAPKIFTRFFTRVKDTPKVLAIDSPAYRKALDARPQIFEPLHDLPLFAEHNEFRFYTWGARECCLPKGATRATLRGSFPELQPGFMLILTEVLGPQTGNAADADPAHRHAVRLRKVTLTEDPVGGQFDEPATNDVVPLTEIEWHAEDALPFSLCVCSLVETDFFPDVSVALGNVVLADHGLHVEGEPLPEVPPANPSLTKVEVRAGDRCEDTQIEPTPQRYRPRVSGAPVTQSAPYDFADISISASAALKWDVRKLLPVLSLDEEGVLERWRPRRDLLSSGAGRREFVAETENDGVTYLRFGDDRFGSRPAEDARLTASYRVGNGHAGNVGAESLVHVASNDPAVVTDLANSPIVSVRNPLAASGGVDPESLERVRQDAPEAFRTQERAVTTDDYAEMARTRCGTEVQRAAATMRWTGSWHTVFVTVDRFGGRRGDEEFEKGLRRCLERYRMAGHDLEVDAPRFVSLEVEMVVCVKRGYLTSDVKRALLAKFSNGTQSNGERGVFHPDNFSFGQTVFASTLYAAAQAVEGVDSVDITVFQRQGDDATSGIEDGRLDFGRLEIARLDNDPDFPEHGVFKLDMKGGR
jgi:hypothetical protein